ncbi:zeta toxin family protein [Haloimpatiens lingqiaonensis]|uniref:zeta toxin family protein n=1 Tax=Haloimpatiens lingqiaonensis TaxID=1380675 RepID=UPI0010FE4DE6|nr:zeta toxin family protein [Haloimpatiens lingqiaonensis]
MPSYTIFAGVNGAGKTSIYKSIYYDENKDEKRINTDEMVARLGSWEDKNLQIQCGKEAVKLIKEYISKGISFNQETTLCGKSISRNIIKAKEQGFYITMNYIGVETPEIAEARVMHRVENGGHGIPSDTINRRYYESIKNLKEIIAVCNEVNIYDNTEIFKEIAFLSDGKLIWKELNTPKWFKEVLEKYEEN